MATRDPSELETDEHWLERLYSLNEVISSTGTPLVGNLFYTHFQDDYVTHPPMELHQQKRIRLARAVAGCSRVLEIGVNGGHSAYLMLTSNPELEFHGVDICDHSYVRPAVEWLKEEFPGRVFLHPGNSLEVVPELARRQMRFDGFHVDGAKQTYYHDIVTCQRMVAGPGAAIVVDDMGNPAVAAVWRRCVRQGLVRPEPVDEAAASERRGNEVGVLVPPTMWRSRMLVPYSTLLIRAEPARRFASRVKHKVVR